MIGKIILAGALVILGGIALSYVFSAASVVRSETDPKVVQAKYEWFKDASSSLDAKVADIGICTEKMHNMEDSYNGTARKDWSNDDKQQYNIWSSECAGIKASYNKLAAEYNSEMAKWNWRFANIGMLPEGATQPLPREYKPYINE